MTFCAPELPSGRGESQLCSVIRTDLRLAAVLVIVAAVACDNSPFEPRGEGERVPVNREITGNISGDTSARYSFAGEPDAVYAIFFEATRGSAGLFVFDSTHHVQVGQVFSGPGAAPFYENPTDRFLSASGAVYNITVRSPSTAAASFRFVVYPVNRAPEHAAARFRLGDTVNGETIDPVVDLDDFLTHGEAGQEIVAVGETPAPLHSGAVFISVEDPATSNFIGFVIAESGTTDSLTSGRIRLLATQDYRFSAGSVTSNTFRLYQGPYRFWTYVINPAPEHRAAAMPLSTEVADERIDRAGDVDEFTFTAAAGADFNAFIQGSGRIFQVEVKRAGGSPIATASSDPADTGLFVHATSRFTAPASGTYVLRVTGSTPSLVADTGGYRLYLYAINHQPEHAAAAIGPGDTVTGEAIDLPGDIDEYSFSATLGEEYNVFLQGQNGSSDTHLKVEVVGPAGAVLRSTQSAGNDSSLFRQVTGRFSIPTTGSYRLRVSGTQSYNDKDQGPYRLFLYRINRKPETVPEVLVFGDSISGEAIDLPGDVDEYRVTVPDSSGANIAVDLENPAVGGNLFVQLLDSAGQVVRQSEVYLTGPGALGRMLLAPGNYTLRVDGNRYGNAYGDPATLRGPYRLWLYRFSYGPEVASDTFAVGDTVTESLEPWGDRDVFHFYGLRNQHVNVKVQGLSAPSSNLDAFLFDVIPPPGVAGYGAFINSPTAASTLDGQQTTRLDLLGTGWYTIQVEGYNGGRAERGPYRFTVQPVETAPEHVNATLVAGDSVVGESIDQPGDWDEFTVTGTPGQTMSVLFNGEQLYTGPYMYLRVFDPVTDDTLAWQPSQFHRIAGPFRIPASGQAKISVSEPMGFFRLCYTATCQSPPLYSFVGPYGFRVIAVNRAPETAPATFAVGDTVRGESIGTIGDIDEFTSTGTPGEQLTLYDRLTTPTTLLDSAIVIEVIDPATGASLAGHGTAIFGSSQFFQVGTFTVPASGTFTLRARVYGESGYGVGQTAYEFFVKRGP